MAAPDEQQPLARARVDERAALGRRQVEVAGERVGALGRLAEQDPQVALLDDRLAEVGAQELDDVLGRELEPGVVVAGRAGELLDELGARGLAHHLPGLVDDDELGREVAPHRVPQQPEGGELGDRADLGVARSRRGR